MLLLESAAIKYIRFNQPPQYLSPLTPLFIFFTLGEESIIHALSVTQEVSTSTRFEVWKFNRRDEATQSRYTSPG